MRKQKIYLSLEIAKDSLISKRKLDALAFSMAIKLTFVDSKIKDATVRRCKEIFCIGSTKVSRLIKDGIEFGYLKRDGKDLISMKLRATEGVNRKLYFEPNTFSISGKCIYKISNIVDIIRETVLLNHIKCQNKMADTFRNSRDPKSTKNYKKAKAFEKSLEKKGRMSAKIKGEFNTLSNARVMKLTNTKLYRARRIVKNLVNDNRILKRETFQSIDDDRNNNFNSFNKNLSNTAQTYKAGYIRFIYGIMCVQLANSYKYVSNDVNYYKPKKR